MKKPLDPYYVAIGRWRRVLHMSTDLTAATKLHALLLLEHASRVKFYAHGLLVAWPRNDTLQKLSGRKAGRRKQVHQDLKDDGIVERRRRGRDWEFTFINSWMFAREQELDSDGLLNEWPHELPRGGSILANEGAVSWSARGQDTAPSNYIMKGHSPNKLEREPTSGRRRSPKPTEPDGGRSAAETRPAGAGRVHSSGSSAGRTNGTDKGHEFAELAWEGVVRLVYETKDPCKAFSQLWLKPDQDEQALRGAWHNAVAAPQESVTSVLLATLVWRLYYEEHRDEYVPHAGKWLKDRGFKTLPLDLTRQSLKDLGTMLVEKRSRASIVKALGLRGTDESEDEENENTEDEDARDERRMDWTDDPDLD